MLFITNCVPKEGIQTEPGRDFNFDPNQNSPGNSLFYCRRNKKGSYTETGSADFLNELKNSKYKQVLLYVHGFNNLPEEDIFPRTKLLQTFCNKAEANETLVVPIIWPCGDKVGIVRDYWDDQKSADASAFSLARLLETFMNWRADTENIENPCLKRINVLAHSMGSRVLRETLCNWNKYHRAGSGMPLLFRNIFLAAPDLVNESLHKGERGQLLSQISRNVVVYYASDDLALRSSKLANLKNAIASRRLGHTGPEDMRKVPDNVYALDCDELNNSYDFPKGHSYFMCTGDEKTPGVVFNHMFETIRRGRVFPNDLRQRRAELDKE